MNTRGITTPLTIGIVALLIIIGAIVYFNVRPESEKMMEQGEDMMEQGEEIMNEGEQMMEEGESMMNEGEAMMEEDIEGAMEDRMGQ